MLSEAVEEYNELDWNRNGIIRCSPSEDAGVTWCEDWIGKENRPEERGITSFAVFSNKTDTAQEPSRGVTEFGSLAKTTSAVSNDSITQTFEESKTTEKKILTP